MICLLSTFMVDITFLIADLKYNERQGVKICEIQPGSMSGFYSREKITPEVDFFTGPDGVLAEKFNAFVSRYASHFWLIDAPIDTLFKKKLLKKGWRRSPSMKMLQQNSHFRQLSQIAPADPHQLASYQGMLYAYYKKIEKSAVEEFLQHFPGIILLDASIYPYLNDKLAISQFLTSNLKPKWKSYPKKTTTANTIINDLECEHYVIKPINALKGRGVIITHKDALASHLLTLFDQDPYWIGDTNERFIVEEFIESDPIRVPHLNNQLFDPTMRISFFLIYDQGSIDIHFISHEWQLPEHPLTAEGTLTQKHKSSVKEPYFAGVDPVTLEKVQSQLREGLPLFYRHLLMR